jgi:hypothetical protein
MERESTKKISSAIVKMGVVLLEIFSLMIAANAGYVSLKPRMEQYTVLNNVPTDFYANITIRVFEGEGCECIPLRGVFINATGRGTDHLTSGLTDDNGSCVLQLQFDKTYRISIQTNNHESVLFDFLVLDDQPFAFNQKKVESSSGSVSLAHALLLKIEHDKKLIK